MLRIFDLIDGAIKERETDSDSSLASAVWIDVADPTEEERERVEAVAGAPLPDLEANGLETSARCFVDADGLHLRSTFLSEHGGRHLAESVAFLLQPEWLITVRPGRLRDFQVLRARSRRGQVETHNAQDLLVDLLEEKIDHFADLLEQIHVRLENLGRQVLEVGEGDLNDAIRELARIENSNGKIRLALTDTQRSAAYIGRNLEGDAAVAAVAHQVAEDAKTLLSHSTFLFERINFLMATAQGFINIEQNKIIKIFSIAAVVFLPPTLVASIYGMNFDRMPELDWVYGYGWAIALMVAAGIAPYLLFKRKGWL